jgi:hypothetical protein
MQHTRDDYEVLGIDRDTATYSTGEIAHRRLARKYHPDRNIDDAVAAVHFHEVGKAWEALRKILPKDLIPMPPLPDAIDPDFDRKMEEAIGSWLIANDSDTSPPKNTIETPQGFDKRNWSTVGAEANPTPGLVISDAQVSRGGRQRGDWTQARIKKKVVSFSLENIEATDAAHLIQYFPNSFAALKILQQNRPGLCLYDAIVSRAAVSRALCIVGQERVARPACEAALLHPLASIEIAQENAARLAPFVVFQGSAVDPAKLIFDLGSLKTYIEDILIPKLIGSDPAS